MLKEQKLKKAAAAKDIENGVPVDDASACAASVEDGSGGAGRGVEPTTWEVYKPLLQNPNQQAVMAMNFAIFSSYSALMAVYPIHVSQMLGESGTTADVGTLFAAAALVGFAGAPLGGYVVTFDEEGGKRRLGRWGGRARERERERARETESERERARARVTEREEEDRRMPRRQKGMVGSVSVCLFKC